MANQNVPNESTNHESRLTLADRAEILTEILRVHSELERLTEALETLADKLTLKPPYNAPSVAVQTLPQDNWQNFYPPADESTGRTTPIPVHHYLTAAEARADKRWIDSAVVITGLTAKGWIELSDPSASQRESLQITENNSHCPLCGSSVRAIPFVGRDSLHREHYKIVVTCRMCGHCVALL
jgi:heterodisulfide reductase subunit A-like polyferredoxin